MSQEINPEIDTTKYVNIDDVEQDIYIGGKLVRNLKAGEEQVIPVWVAQVGAKHLVDKILQEKHNIKDTLRDTELRRSLFAQILPEMAEARKIVPLTDEQFRIKVDEELKRQGDVIKSFAQKSEETSEKDKTIEDLSNKVEELKKLVLKEKKVARK